MSHPFSGAHPFTFDNMVNELRNVMDRFPDVRSGNNTVYRVADAAIGAFSVFYTQSPSFLAHQKAMEETKGRSNAQTVMPLSILRETPSNIPRSFMLVSETHL